MAERFPVHLAGTSPLLLRRTWNHFAAGFLWLRKVAFHFARSLRDIPRVCTSSLIAPHDRVCKKFRTLRSTDVAATIGV